MAHSQDAGEIDKSVIHDPWKLLGTKVRYVLCPKCGHNSSEVFFYDHTGEIRVTCDCCGEHFVAVKGAYSITTSPIIISLD